MHRLIYGARLVVAIAALWAIGASLYIFFSPISVQGVTASSIFGASTVVETFTREQSWYETQGLWGVFVLVIFAGFYLLAARLAWRNKYNAFAIMSVIALALSVISGFSIGGIYLPAAFALIIGALMFLSANWLRPRK